MTTMPSSSSTVGTPANPLKNRLQNVGSNPTIRKLMQDNLLIARNRLQTAIAALKFLYPAEETLAKAQYDELAALVGRVNKLVPVSIPLEHHDNKKAELQRQVRALTEEIGSLKQQLKQAKKDKERELEAQALEGHTKNAKLRNDLKEADELTGNFARHVVSAETELIRLRKVTNTAGRHGEKARKESSSGKSALTKEELPLSHSRSGAFSVVGNKTQNGQSDYEELNGYYASSESASTLPQEQKSKSRKRSAAEMARRFWETSSDSEENDSDRLSVPKRRRTQITNRTIHRFQKEDSNSGFKADPRFVPASATHTSISPRVRRKTVQASKVKSRSPIGKSKWSNRPPVGPTQGHSSQDHAINRATFMAEIDHSDETGTIRHRSSNTSSSGALSGVSRNRPSHEQILQTPFERRDAGSESASEVATEIMDLSQSNFAFTAPQSEFTIAEDGSEDSDKENSRPDLVSDHSEASDKDDDDVSQEGHQNMHQSNDNDQSRQITPPRQFGDVLTAHHTTSPGNDAPLETGNGQQILVTSDVKEESPMPGTEAAADVRNSLEGNDS